MSRFRYVAYRADGTKVTGTVDAGSSTDALRALQGDALVISSIDAVANGGGAPRSNATPAWAALLVRQLATLLAAGVTIDQAIRMIGKQQTVKSAKSVLASIEAAVTSGKPLSVALEPCRLPAVALAMIKAGEVSGRFARGLASAADQLEQRESLRAKTRSAMIYPLVLLLTAIATLSIVAFVLVPSLMPLFRDAKADPPFVLLVLDGAATFLSDNRLTAGLAVIGGSLAVVMFSKSVGGQRLFHAALMRIPVVGPVVRDVNCVALAQTVGALLDGRVPAPQALALGVEGLSNAALRAELANVSQLVSEGRRISDALQPLSNRGSAIADFAVIGEQTGEIGKSLLNFAAMTGDDVSRRIDRLVSVLGPAMTIGTAVFVGVIIVSIMQAILGVNELALR